MLVMMHRRHRLKHYKEVYDYCDEQLRYVSSLPNRYIHWHLLEVQQTPAVNPPHEDAGNDIARSS
jgi:hypothetical protein